MMMKGGPHIKRLFRAIGDICPKGEEFGEDHAVVMLALSQLVMFPMICMRWRFSFMAAAVVGQLLATRNFKAPLILAVKVLVVDVPALVVSAALERILMFIPGIEMLQQAVLWEYQYIGAFAALVAFVWIVRRIIRELPMTMKYNRRQCCLFAFGVLNSCYIWGWSCYTLVLIQRGQLPVKLNEIIAYTFFMRYGDLVFSLVHQMFHTDGNLYNLHKGHHAVFSYCGFDCETESPLEKAFESSVMLNNRGDIMTRFEFLVMDHAGHSYGMAYDWHHRQHHLEPHTQLMIDPVMYESRKHFESYSDVFKNDHFVDESDGPELLKKSQKHAIYERFGRPPLVKNSQLEKWIAWLRTAYFA
jgi:sterol desaturase/sphingolipid hydroxylase (fatty acid hydroxylase superfamily)